MKLGIFAKTYSRSSLNEIYEQMQADSMQVTQFNMACVGLPSMPDKIPPSVVTDIQTTAAQYDIEMVALSGTFNMIHPDQDVVKTGLKQLAVLADVTSQIGTNLITLCTGTRDVEDKWRHHPDNASPEAWSDLLKSMASALEIAEKYNVNLGIEPEKANVIDTAVKARELLDYFGTSRLKIVLDPANLFEQATPSEANALLDEACELLAEDIVIAHAKDRDVDGNFVAAGQGMLDYAHYIQRLKTISFAGSLILHGLSEAEVSDSADYVKQFL